MKRFKARFISILFLFILLGCGGGMDNEGVSAEKPLVISINEGVSAEKPLVISIKGNLVSAKIERLPLGEVLGDLARQAHIKVKVEGSVAGEKISVEFKDLPMDEGIARILKGKNYILTYAKSPSSEGNPGLSKVVEVKVFSEGRGPSMTSGGKNSGAATPMEEIGQGRQRSLQEWMKEAKESPDPVARAAALEALVAQEKEEDILPTIVSALQDEDLQVREAALEILEDDMSGPLPIGSIAKVALKDTSSQLRMNALELMVDTYEMGALDTLNKALQDPDKRVRGLARELLDELMKKGQ